MTPLVRACGIPSQLTDPWTSGQGQSQHIEIDAGSAVLAVSFSANDKHLVRGDKEGVRVGRTGNKWQASKSGMPIAGGTDTRPVVTSLDRQAGRVCLGCVDLRTSLEGQRE